jgi:CRISPR-associated protein Cas6
LDNSLCSNPLVELRWPIMGDRLPTDHGYRLYAALVGKIPELKNINWQNGLISGDLDKSWLKLNRSSYLMIRCMSNQVIHFSILDSGIIRVGQNLIELGVSEGETLTWKPELKSDFVTIKCQTCRYEPFDFGVALGKQLQYMNIESFPTLGERKAIKIKDASVVGYAVRFLDLKPDESKSLLKTGIGGRRKIGGGIFR